MSYGDQQQPLETGGNAGSRHFAAPDARLSVEVQRAIQAAGFIKVYVNHEDKWETHYTFYGKDGAMELPVKGWRVSYGHRRGDGSKTVWVEEWIAGWPQEWFDTGYVLIKTPSNDVHPKNSTRE